MDSEAEAEFGAFVAARSATLFRTAYLLTGDRHEAEELVQAALVKVALRWRRIGTGFSGEMFTDPQCVLDARTGQVVSTLNQGAPLDGWYDDDHLLRVENPSIAHPRLTLQRVDLRGRVVGETPLTVPVVHDGAMQTEGVRIGSGLDLTGAAAKLRF